jgi:hypothetical protein
MGASLCVGRHVHSWLGGSAVTFRTGGLSLSASREYASLPTICPLPTASAPSLTPGILSCYASICDAGRS